MKLKGPETEMPALGSTEGDCNRVSLAGLWITRVPKLDEHGLAVPRNPTMRAISLTVTASFVIVRCAFIAARSLQGWCRIEDAAGPCR